MPPRHGSWLHMAESELSALQRLCLDRRPGDRATMQREVAGSLAGCPDPTWLRPGRKPDAGVKIRYRPEIKPFLEVPGLSSR